MRTVLGLTPVALSILYLQAQTPTYTKLDYVGKGNPAQDLDLYLPSGNGPFPLVAETKGMVSAAD